MVFLIECENMKNREMKIIFVIGIGDTSITALKKLGWNVEAQVLELEKEVAEMRQALARKEELLKRKHKQLGFSYLNELKELERQFINK